ncbi:YopX family protein [Paenibacillus oleatilyticus]|uniref:YopX family protein n=1 Tax=Paenibacillus oleatilyticus TaxID=2594886 RepID=A0ABV4VCF8_9BACL
MIAREIKFRALAHDRQGNFEWFYYGPRENPQIPAKYLFVKVFDVMYTGLRDSKRTKEYPNGQEIYEGDIFPPGTRTRGEVQIVCYDLEQAKYKSVPLSLYNSNAGDGGWTGYSLNPYSEIIGNIYENPDLLEANT